MNNENSVLVTHRDIVGKKKLGGVGNYYKALQPHLSDAVHFFTVGKREGKVGFFRAVIQLSTDYWRLWQVLDGGSLKLVHVNPSLSRNCLLRDGVSLAIARKRGKKTLVFFHGWDESTCRWIGKYGRGLFRWFLGRANGAVVLSQQFADQLRSWGYVGPIFVETTSVDDSLLGISPGVEGEKKEAKDPLRLLFLARVERDKGVFVAIDAFAKIREQMSGVELSIAGDGGARKEAEAYVRARGLSGVNFTGYVQGVDKITAYRKADIYVFPSNHGEGMPISVLEAMAFGLPIVTTAVGGMADFFEDGKLGRVVETADPGAFAQGIRRLAEDPEGRKAMGDYGAAFARKNFLASSVASRLEEIWQAILEEKVTVGQTVSWVKSSSARPEVAAAGVPDHATS